MSASSDNKSGNIAPPVVSFESIMARTKPTSADDDGSIHLARWYDIWALGVVTVIGGQYYGWNAILTCGFGSWAVMQVLMGFAFICLMLCVAEVTSTIAFSGGAYGLARVVLGFYPGFLVGSLQLIEFTAMTSASVAFIGNFFVTELNISNEYYAILIWIAFYVISLSFVIPGGRWMWSFNMLQFVVGCILPIAIYVFGSFRWVDFNANAPLLTGTSNDDYAGGYNATASASGVPLVTINDTPLSSMDNWFSGGFSAWFQLFPVATWAYGGIEALELTTNLAKDPKESVPLGMALAVATLFVCNILLIFVGVSLPPGINALTDLSYPMNPGFDLIFGWADSSSSSSSWLMLPAQYSMAYGFLLPVGKLVFALSDSNLLPSFLGLRNATNHNRAVLLSVGLGFIFCLVGLFSKAFNASIQNIAILSMFVTFLSVLYGFYRMRTKYQSLERSFRSPLGMAGAAYAFIYFSMGIVSTAFYQDDQYIALISVAALCALLSIYYYLFAMTTQVFSEDELKSVFKLHVINYNDRMRRQVANKGKRKLMKQALKKFKIPTVDMRSMGFSAASESSLASSSQEIVAQLFTQKSIQVSVRGAGRSSSFDSSAHGPDVNLFTKRSSKNISTSEGPATDTVGGAGDGDHAYTGGTGKLPSTAEGGGKEESEVDMTSIPKPRISSMLSRKISNSKVVPINSSDSGDQDHIANALKDTYTDMIARSRPSTPVAVVYEEGGVDGPDDVVDLLHKDC